MAFFRNFLECCQGPSFTATQSYAQLEDHLNRVKLDASNIGSDVVVVKNGHRICGSGAALGNAPLVQNKAYFEVKLQQNGIWGVGVANRGIDLNKVPLGDDDHSWVLRHDGQFCFGGNVITSMQQLIDEGDIIGIAYDHLDLSIYKNGNPLGLSVSGIKGQVYPVVYVDEGAILDIQFTTLWYGPPKGYEEVMLEKTIL